MSTDAMKAFDKGKNSGSMFKLDLDVMRANKMNAESYVRLWLTAWHTKLTSEKLEIAKIHTILWYGQSVAQPDGYPPSGIPSSEAHTLALAKSGRCGDEFTNLTAVDKNQQIQILSKISGEVIADPDEDYYKRATKIRTAMDKFRHYVTVALGEKLNGPFDLGMISSYNLLLQWVYKKCNVTRTMESMADYFEDLDKALNDDTDCQGMKFRMVMNKLFLTGTTAKPIPFPDMEGDTTKLTKKEEFLPSHCMLFLFNKYKKMNRKTWKGIEDEFRAEIGGTNYTRDKWMENKPRLYELIDQKTKSSSSRAGINRAQADEDGDDDGDDDRIELEIEPGLICYVSPKQKSGRQQNWKSKVQKFTAAAKRGQKSNNFNNQSGQKQNSWSKQTPATYWNCRMCPSKNGKPVQHKRGQKCPQNGFIPQRMIAAVQSSENQEIEQNQASEIAEDENKPKSNGQVASMRSKDKFVYDSSSSDNSF